MPFGQDYLPILQLCLLPLVVTILWRVELAGQKVPRALILVCATLSLLGFSLGFSTRSLHSKRIVITRFSDDPIGAKSRIFREQVESRLEQISSQRIVRFPNAFTAFREVRRRFGDPRQYDAVLWGKLDSFQINFPSRIGQEEGQDRLERFLGLRLVSQTPSIALSRSFDSGTLDFVADVLGALEYDSSTDAMAAARREILLKSALKVESRWRSRAHRALPAWLLANSALERAFGSDAIELAELQCALNYYLTASGMFRADDNPELAASVYNNWGVALALHGWLVGDRSSLELAKKQFQRAFSSRTMPSTTGFPLRAWQSARSNLMLLSGRRRSKIHAAEQAQERKANNGESRKKRAGKRQLQTADRVD